MEIILKWEGVVIWLVSIFIVSILSKQKPWKIGIAFWLGIISVFILEFFIFIIQSSQSLHEPDYIFLLIQFISALSMSFIINKFALEYEKIKKLKSTKLDTVESTLNKLNNYPEYLLMIGLMGTFTSLLLVLSKINFSGNINSTEALTQLQGIIGLIGLKFKISIWGLIFATLLRIFPYHEAEGIVEHYIKDLEFKKYILKSIEKIESYNKKLSEEFLEYFYKAAENIQEASENLHTGSSEFKESAINIRTAIFDFSDKTEKTMNDLKNTFTNLIKDFNKNVKETFNKINNASNELSSSTENLTKSIEDLQLSLNQSINDLEKSVNETFKNFQEGVQVSLEDMSKKVSKTLKEMTDELGKTTSDMATELSNTLEILKEYINKIATNYKEISKTLKEFNYQFNRILELTDKLISTTSELILKLKKFNEEQLETLDNNLKDIKDSLVNIESKIDDFMKIYGTEEPSANLLKNLNEGLKNVEKNINKLIQAYKIQDGLNDEEKQN